MRCCGAPKRDAGLIDNDGNVNYAKTNKRVKVEPNPIPIKKEPECNYSSIHDIKTANPIATSTWTAVSILSIIFC